MTEFAGIPIAALDFYDDLEADNSKTYFEAHKSVYRESVREPLIALCAELEPEFGPAKLFRPHRDVRFAADKSPYKTHQGAYISQAAAVGYYVQVSAPGLMVAGGWYAPDTRSVAKYRAAVLDDDAGELLVGICADLVEQGYELGGETLKTRPRGVAEDHPRLDLLRHKSLSASKDYGAPPWLATRKVTTTVAEDWRALTPLVQWLTGVIGGPDPD